MIKSLIVVLFLFIFYSLGKALYYLVHDRASSTRMVKALSWRIGLSLALFILLIIAFGMGWIAPNT